jgi:hypothetical protein
MRNEDFGTATADGYSLPTVGQRRNILLACGKTRS